MNLPKCTLFTEKVIHWIVEDQNVTSSELPSVYFRHFHFSNIDFLFTLSGLVTFNKCTFEGHTLILDVSKGQGQQELEVTEETVRSFHSSDTEEFAINIISSQFVDRMLFINVYAAARKIKITDSSDSPVLIATHEVGITAQQQTTRP